MLAGIAGCGAAIHVQTACPSGWTGKLRSSSDELTSSLNGFPEPLPSNPLFPLPLAAPGPIDAEGLAPNLLFSHEPPKSAVQTLIAVVSHHEIRPFRNRHRAKVVARIDGAIDDSGVDALGEGLVVERPPIDEHDLALNLDAVPWCANNALDEIFFLVLRKPEDDDVATQRLAELDERVGGVAIDRRKRHLKFAVARPLNAIRELAHEDMIADQESGDHGTRRNLERLDDEHADGKRQEHGDHDRFCIFPEYRLPGRLRHCRHALSSGLGRARRHVIRTGTIRFNAHSSPTFRIAKKAS